MHRPLISGSRRRHINKFKSVAGNYIIAFSSIFPLNHSYTPNWYQMVWAISRNLTKNSEWKLFIYCASPLKHGHCQEKQHSRKLLDYAFRHCYRITVCGGCIRLSLMFFFFCFVGKNNKSSSPHPLQQNSQSGKNMFWREVNTMTGGSVNWCGRR